MPGALSMPSRHETTHELPSAPGRRHALEYPWHRIQPICAFIRDNGGATWLFIAHLPHGADRSPPSALMPVKCRDGRAVTDAYAAGLWPQCPVHLACHPATKPCANCHTLQAGGMCSSIRGIASNLFALSFAITAARPDYLSRACRAEQIAAPSALSKRVYKIWRCSAHNRICPKSN